VLRGTFRPDRHAAPSAPPPVPLSAADRKFVLAGLPPDARRVVTRVLAEFADFTPLDLEHLRNFGLTAARLRALQATAEPAASPALARELRNYERLAKLLDLERG